MGLLQIATASDPKRELQYKARGAAIRAIQEGRLPGQQPSMTHGPLDTVPVAVVRAGHAGTALFVSLGFALVAAADGRPWRELLLVWFTALMGQLVMGWFNDLLDYRADRIHHRTRKPLATGTLDPDWMWFAFAVGCCLLVPAALLNGVVAGLVYLGAVALALLTTAIPPIRRGVLSFLPFMATFALYACFLSLGGWGGRHLGAWPQPAILVASAFIGLGVHVMSSVRGLVADNQDDWTYLPLVAARQIGAFWLFIAGLVIVMAGASGILVTWASVGFTR